MKSPINEIRLAFYRASKSRDIKLQQDIFYFYIDQNQNYPEDALDFLIETLSTKELFTKQGFNKFIIENLSFTHKLLATQKEKLLNTILGYYSQYKNSNFCETICETISDMYDNDKAIQVFDQLYPSASPDGKNGIELTCDSIVYQSDNKHKATIITKIRTFIPDYLHPSG